MELIEKQIAISMPKLKEFLSIQWDGHFIYQYLDKYPEKRENAIIKFGRERINDWSKSNHSKSIAPKDSITLLDFAYTIGIDPFMAYQVNYRNWCIFLKSLDGNISLGGTVKFGQINKSLKFIDFFFSPSTNFPGKTIQDIWNKNNIDKEFFFYEFESDIEEDQKETEQKILVKPKAFNKGQVIHFGYKKHKHIIGYEKNGTPIRMYDFWQEYKFVFIRPVKDMIYLLNMEEDWNDDKRNIKIKEKRKVKQFKQMKKNEDFSQFKERAKKELYSVFIMNILGGFEYDIIQENQPFLMKTRFQEPKTKFMVYSSEDFELKLVGKKLQNIIEIYDKPC